MRKTIHNIIETAIKLYALIQYNIYPKRGIASLSIPAYFCRNN